MAHMIPYYFSHSNCGKVRIIIASFGYGPRVAAETFANLLNLTIDKWQVNSASLENKKFEVTYNFGVAQPDDEPETSFKIWIDCLMWLRSSIPTKVADYDLFLAENFFVTNPTLIKQMNGSIIRDIAPIYSLNGNSALKKIPENKNNKERHILISFGGIETPFTTDIHRFPIPKVVLESLVFASQRLKDNRKIICCIPLHILKKLQQNPNFSGIQFISPTQKEFLPILNDASIYIVQPGLYGPFEAFESGIPTVFTTPFSYTQVCQAKAYDKEGVAGYIPMWKDLDNKIGYLDGDIENEEETCSEKIGNWIEENIIESNSNHYYDWAEKVLRDEIISPQLTKKRIQFIEQHVNLKMNNIQKIIQEYEILRMH